MTGSKFLRGARFALSFLLALTFAQAAFGETRVTPLGDGQFSVDMRGCSVRLDKHGEVLSEGRDCSRGQLIDAQDAVKTYRREQEGSDDHEYRGSSHDAPRVNGMPNGNVSVDMRGCSVLFDRRGDVVNSGRDCSRGQMTDARRAMEGYRREQYGSDDHSGGGYNDENAHKIIGDGKATLRDRPSKDGSRVTSMNRGDYVDVIKCEKHHGNQWCRVRYNNQEGWVGKRRLKKVD